MKNSCRKLEAFGCDQILLTDRGTFFGYNMLVNDMRSFPIMAETGYPVCYDATHSIQLPTSMGNISGGQREYIPNLTRAAAACGLMPCLWKCTTIHPTHCRMPTQFLILNILKLYWHMRKPYMTSEENWGQNGEMTMSTRNNHDTDITVADVMLSLEKTPKTSGRTLLKRRLKSWINIDLVLCASLVLMAHSGYNHRRWYSTNT